MSHQRHRQSRYSYSPSSPSPSMTSEEIPEQPEKKEEEETKKKPMMVGYKVDEIDKLILFAGVGVLAVLILDAVVRLACRGQKSPTTGLGTNIITIDGKQFVQI